MKMGLHNAVFMTEEKKNDRPKKEVGGEGGKEGGREKVGVTRKKKKSQNSLENSNWMRPIFQVNYPPKYRYFPF